MTAHAPIRVGIGGWSYPPWRETFYPPEVPRSGELAWASRQLATIEVNSTFYRTQSRSTYAAWRDATPPGFVFALKAPRYAVQRRVLAEAGPSIERFVESGIDALGDKLGPLLWQLAPGYAYDADDLEAFLRLLPARVARLPLRHVLEVRHPSFGDPDFLAQAARHNVAIAHLDEPEVAGAPGGGVVYARFKRSQARLRAGYPARSLDAIARQAQAWAGQAEAVYVYFINGAKERAPGAALALAGRLTQGK